MTLYFDAFTRFGRRMKQHRAHPYTFEHLQNELDHCSISAALVADTRCLYYDAMHQNQKLVEQLKPFDHLFPIWNVHPHYLGDFPEPAELTAQMQKHNVRAVTIHPTENGWNPLSKTSQPLLRELEKNRTLTIVEFPAELPEQQLEPLLDQYPNLPLLIRRVRWNRQRFIIPLLLRYKNLHLAFDEFQMHMGPEFLVDKGLEDQLLFCSNAPTMSAGAHRAYIDYADIPQSAKDKFANKNLTRLLKGLAPPRERINTSEDELMHAARQGKPVPALVVDAHCHILDEGLHGGGQTNVMIDGGPKGVLKLANRLGVKAMGFMSWNGTVGLHADDGNITTKAALDAMPPTCWGLASFDPFDPPELTRKKIEEVFKDKRFLGLKPYPHFNVAYDHPNFEPWWQFGNQHHLYAMIHMTRWDFSELDFLCPKYPNMTWVVAHCGGDYETADGAIKRAQKFPNFRAEITLTPVPNGIIDYLVAGCGPDKVLYGTDLPMRDPRQQFGWVVYSRLAPDDKRKVLGKNTQSLIGDIRRFNQIPDPLQTAAHSP